MPDLNLGPPPERSPLPAVLIAAGVLALIAVAVFLFNPRKTAEISVAKVAFYAPHTTFEAMQGGPHVVEEPTETQDDLYVVLTVKIDDKLRIPIILGSDSMSVTNADGTQVDGQPVGASDFARLEETFPALQPMIGKPLTYFDQIAPGDSREGSVVVAFPGMTEAAWQAKKLATLTFNLEHQEPLTVAVK